MRPMDIVMWIILASAFLAALKYSGGFATDVKSIDTFATDESKVLSGQA